MTQTIQQRRALADRVRRTCVPFSRRREQRANVIQWRDQAEATRALRQLPLPEPKEVTDTDPPVLSMIVGAAFSLVLWALFGWLVVALIDAVLGAL